MSPVNHSTLTINILTTLKTSEQERLAWSGRLVTAQSEVARVRFHASKQRNNAVFFASPFENRSQNGSLCSDNSRTYYALQKEFGTLHLTTHRRIFKE